MSLFSGEIGMPRTQGQLGAMIKLGGRVQPRHEADSQGPTLGRRCRHLIGCGIRTGEGLFRFSVEARGGFPDCCSMIGPCRSMPGPSVPEGQLQVNSVVCSRGARRIARHLLEDRDLQDARALGSGRIDGCVNVKNVDLVSVEARGGLPDTCWRIGTWMPGP